MLSPARTATVPVWDAPATTISFAGPHGGAGTSTLCLLIAHAVAATSAAPSLTVDLAGRSRGGLSVLGAAAGQTTAEGTAAVAAHGRGLPQPFGINDSGVRIIGTHPGGVEELDRTHETIAARVVEAVHSGSGDAQIAQLARLAVREDRTWQALRWDNDQVAEAMARVLDRAIPHHSIVGVDLGMIDSGQLARVVARRADLHVWVVPGRPHSLEIAERRLPFAPFEPQGAEAIAVWQSGDQAPSAKRLSALGDRRGCPVVRIADHGDPARGWEAMVDRCLSGIEDLCALA